MLIKLLVYGIGGMIALFYAWTTQFKWWLLGGMAIYGCIVFVRFMVKMGEEDNKKHEEA